MSCCPSAPPITPSSDSPPLNGPEQQLRPGETAECFSKRAGNTTGRLDDTVPRLNKIENEAVNSDCSAKIKLQFKLTDGSDVTPVFWRLKAGSDATPGVTLTTAGLMSGTFDPSVHEKKLKITVEAVTTDAATTEDSIIDERTYTFSPSLCKGGDSIKFVTPLQNAIFKDPYGMRFHPIQKVEKMHTGIDMVMPTKGVNGDVYAAADGEVIKAANTDPRGYGNAIHIKHFNSAGKALCTTTYNHLHQMLVKVGDKVSAGQKIALEGGAKGDPGSGGSTGLHLHFECKLPNGSFTDPAPYFKGAVNVALAGDPSETTSKAPSGAAVTSADADAKGGCPPTPEYPVNPAQPEPAAEAAPANGASAFEKAWFFTMKFEVGPHWAVPPGTEPTDTEIVQGLCDTPAQKKKTGYKNWAGESGGETKFGIAKSGNPRTDIKAIDYKGCKDIGFANYWQRGVIKPAVLESQGAKYLAVFMFDTNYQHGMGNAKTIWDDSAVGNGPWTDKASQMAALDRLYQRRLEFANTLKVVSNRKGVARRVEECYAYVKGLTF